MYSWGQLRHGLCVQEPTIRVTQLAQIPTRFEPQIVKGKSLTEAVNAYKNLVALLTRHVWYARHTISLRYDWMEV